MATVNKDFVTRNGVTAGGLVKGTRLESTVASGTAPITVASNTVVTNLNADLLDGQHASSFISNPMTTLGDMLYAGNSGTVTRLANAGTTNGVYILQETVSGNTAGAPSWLGTTGSGNVVLATSPSISTSLVTSSSSFDLLNTTATTINFGGAATTLNVGNASGTVVIAGDLTVNGTTTTINSTVISVDDKNFTLGDVASPTNTTADGGGITLKGATDKTFNWVNATGAWTSSENIDIATGKSYQINGVSILSATALGSSVVSSSLTSVGTIGTGTWQGSIIAGQYGGTGVNNSGKTITLGGNLTTSGAFATTLTVTNTTNVTLPTTGTLATLAGSEALTNKSYNGLTLTSTTGTFTLTNGKTFAVQNSITLDGTDSTTITLPSTSGTVALNNQTFFLGTTSIAINRASAALALTGITSIDGSAASLAMTNADVTSKTVTVNANNTPTNIDSFAVATYTSAEYLIQMKQGTKMTTTKVVVMWDGTDVHVNEYGVTDATAGAANATISASVATGTCTVTASSSDAATTNVVIKSAVTYIKA